MVYSANTITHISNLKNVFEAIKKLLNPNGVIIIEDPSLLELIKYNSYDQFYNEHIYIFSLLSLNKFLDSIDLCIFDIENIKTHGGSLRYFVKIKKNANYKRTKNFFKQLKDEKKFGLNKLSTYLKFSNRVLKSKKKLISILQRINGKGEKVIGYGATAKSVTVLNFCNINSSLIQFFVDTTPAKKFKYIPGTDIFIKPYSKKLIKNVNYIFLGAWNFKREIFNKEKDFVKKKGKFITHIPFPRIL
jgi:methylation protein EvaC